MRTLIFLLLQLLSVPVYAIDQPISDFIKLVRGGQEIYTNRNYDNCKIIKIEHDLDSNGKIDFLLSTDCPYGKGGGWGNGGVGWQIYFSKNNSFQKSGGIFFHPLAVLFEASSTNELEFYYHYYKHSGCCEGTFYKVLVTQGSVIELDKKYFTDTNLQGSPGYEKYKKLFKDNRPPISSHCEIKEIELGGCKWKNGY